MRNEIVEGFRLSPQQEHLWRLQQADQGLPYRAICVVQIAGPLDPDLLRAAILQVGDRHEIVRTIFHHLPELALPLQVIDKHAGIPIQVHDLSGLAPEEQALKAETLLQEASRVPLDFTRGPLAQFFLLKLSSDRQRLIVSLPALYADTTALNNLIHAIGRSYAAQIDQHEPFDAPTQYVDFAEWQNELLEAEDTESGRAYWRKQDHSALATLKLPFEAVIPESLAFVPGCLALMVDPPVVARVEALAEQYRRSPSAILLACWHVLLWRISRQPDVIVGVGYDGRKYQELEEAIGLFAKYLPLQCRLDGRLSFGLLLSQIGESLDEAHTYQESFAWNQHTLPDGNRDLPAFWPFCFDFEQQPADCTIHGVTFSIDKVYSCFDRFKIKLSCVYVDRSLRTDFHYDSHLFTVEDIHRLAEQFHTLIADATRQPEGAIGSFALLNDVERQRVLVDFNRTAADYPQRSCIHELFQEQVERTPDAIAIVFDRPPTNDQRPTTEDRGWKIEDRRSKIAGFPSSILDPRSSVLSPQSSVLSPEHLTYRELNTRANRLAHHLRALGVGPEMRVGICMQRSPELLVAMLGVLKTGGAYVPLDPTYPRERLAFMIDDSLVSVLLTQERLVNALPTSWALVVCLDADWPVVAREQAENPLSTAQAENLAYVIYTSGSTGQPKGVLVSHQNLVHSTTARARYYPEPVGSFLLLSAFTFDSSVAGIFWTLCQGGCLVLPREDFQHELSQLVELLDRGRISELLCLPSLYALLLTQAKPHQMASARRVIVAGEACAAELVERHHAMLANAALYNEYGPTEGTVWSSVHNCSPQALNARVPIGRPIANTQIYLLEPQLQPAPIGVPAELYIGGAGVARGYLGRPDLTAERFIPNPFTEGMGDGGWGMEDSPPIPHPPSPIPRLYKTGDLARYRPDGSIEFLGRIDDQVKLRGYRIELEEIEAVLRQHPAVRDALVAAREDAPGDRRLVAYVVPKIEDRRLKIEDSNLGSSEKLSSIFYPLSSELRAFLQAKLPYYMVPAVFVLLKAMPRLPNGKIDRRSLPTPDDARPDLEERFVAPRTPTEELLAGIWAEVLGLAQVGVHDNFFDLGGHSLLVVQVMSRVRDTLFVELTMRQLFEVPTVAALAERITAAQRDTPDLLPPLRPVERNGLLPLSFAQQRLWFLDQLEPGRPIYNLPAAVRMIGALDRPALDQSLSMIVRRHEVLRTTFPAVDGYPAQLIAAPRPLPLPVVSLLGMSRLEQEPIVLRLAQEEAQRPFDLARGPLLRAALLQLGETEHVVLLNMHHIVSDAWSVGVFIQEIMTLYTAFAAGRPPMLPELPVQYADYAVWQRTWLQGDMLARQLDYWKRQLAGLAPLDLPVDRPRPTLQTFRGAFQPFALSPDLPAKLVALSRRAGVTLFMLLLAAFQTLLTRYSAQDDIVIGTTIANRSRAEIEPLIGFFLNTLALRTDASGNPTFWELLGRIREVCLAAYAHQDAPFEQVVEVLQAERDLSRHPLFQVSFALEHASITPVEAPDLNLRPLAIAGTTAKFDLSLSVRGGTNGLAGGMLYSTDLFDAATIERMLGHFCILLEGIVVQPEQRLSDLPLLTAAERQVLMGWNAVRVTYSRDRLVHQLFEAQAARIPDAVAVVFDRPTTNDQRPTTNKETRRQGDKETRPSAETQLPTPNTQHPTPNTQHLTYQELNRRANQLAHHLRALGVGPERLVGVCMERSPELVVALLGIFKAGGAYIPLDPAYPQERLAFMLEDSQASVLLVQERLIASLPAHTARVIAIDADWEAIARSRVQDLPGGVADANLAYLIYTSGTTGRPKAVMVEHGNLLNTLLAAIAGLNFVDRERIPCIAPFSFDIVLFELLTPLLLGGTSFLLTRQQILDVADFAGLMRDVTLLHTSPGLMRQFVNFVKDNRIERLYRHITRFFVGGDLIPIKLVEDLQELFPSAQIYLGYGPTEGSIICTLYALPSGQRLHKHIIGTPLNNMIVRLYDSYQNLVPIGVPGELHIGGDGVARGYRRRPDLTAERFVPDPFGEGMGDGGWGMGNESSIPHPPSPIPRLYRTGDLARYLPDGNIEFLGRIDHQVKVRGFRIELGEIETVLGQHPAVRSCLVVAREDTPGDKRLVAYVVLRTEGRGLSGADSSVLSPQSSVLGELRAFLKERLPDYMIPAAFVPLAALPLTSNGKLDRRALPAPEAVRPDLDDAFVAPRNQVEAILAAIWATVLRLDRAGVNDNFFALGGDSILSIQIVSRAREAGLRLSPKDMFLHQTIAELAAVVGSSPDAAATQDLVTGRVPLTPIQHHFFAQQQPAPHHFNQPLLLTLQQRLAPALLARALALLLAHHDALRLRFVQTADGWDQYSAAAEVHPLLTQVDLSRLEPAVQGAAVEVAAAALQTSLDLSEGPLLRAALFDLGADQPGRLLLIVHHLVVDGVSWRVLLEDLYTACTQLMAGQAVTLPPKTTAFQQWAERLVAYAQSDTLQAERPYWQATLSHAVHRLPRDHPAGANTVAAAGMVRDALSAQETHALLHAVPAAYHTQINDVLLSALAQAVGAWSEAALLVDLEGHGREDLFADVDLSRTVGWCTTLYPVLLDVRGTAEPGAALQAVKEQLRQVPQRGIGYGVLRYLVADTALRDGAAAEIKFNYLGQVDQVVGTTGGLFGGARESSGPSRDPRGLRSHLIDVSGIIVGGQLHLTWTYSVLVYEQATIAGLAQRYLAALRDLIAHCLMPDAGGFTPSDFPLARLDQPTLARLVGGDARVEDIYPLSPMQQGMLFHTLYDADPGTYVEHLSCTLHGDLNITTFKDAWQQVTDRHPVFRTSFVWEGLDEPLQIVWRQAALLWELGDWRGLAPDEQEARRIAFLQADHARGFSLSQAPLMRLALFQLTENAYTFVWSHHHLLLDGWSLPLVLREVVVGYSAACYGQEPQYAQPRPYRDYIAWLQRQDLAKAEAFWRRFLQGVTGPTPLGVDRPIGSMDAVAEPYLEQQRQLSKSASAALQGFARQRGLTLNTVVQGAWALLLSRYSGEADVVFGVTVAGRPPDLPGSETMVGLFINTLPVRVPALPQTPVLPWLRQIQEQQAELRQYEYSPLVQVQGWSAVPRGLPLFESILVFENYPVGEAIATETRRPNLMIQNVRAVDRNNYPLTLGVGMGPELVLTVVYDCRRFEDDAIVRLLGQYEEVLAGVVARPEAPLAALPWLTEAERQQLLAWSTPPPAAPGSLPIHALIAAQAARRPDACALLDGQLQLSYAALCARAAQLAHLLHSYGAGPDLVVALALPRSADLVLALLGVLSAGAAALPLDLASPPARLAGILHTSAAALLLTLQPLADTLPATTLPPLCLDQLAQQLATLPTTAPPLALHPDQLAYVVYTSGSTGSPKGVAVAHRGLPNLLAAQADAFALSPTSRVLQFAPLSVDAGLAEVLVSLGAGATLVLAPAHARVPGAALLAFLEQQAITTVTLPPTVLALLPAQPLPQLHTLVAAGEACSAELVARWGNTSRLLNAYGPTEASVCASLGTLTPGAPVTIGRPLAGCEVYVLDERMQPVGVGVVGELYLGGGGLARGYLGRADLTAERFVPNPFAQVLGDGCWVTGALSSNTQHPTPNPFAEVMDDGWWVTGALSSNTPHPTPNPFAEVMGDGCWVTGALSSNTPHPTPNTRLYRTGDLARWLADGTLAFVGRRDRQLKVRAYRVELAEVEALLGTHPQVQAAVVEARTLVVGDVRLVAYLVTSNELQVTSREDSSLVTDVRAFLKQRLPEYMVPADFVLLSALPLLPNGKVDHSALPAPDRSRPDQQESFVAPRNPIEEMLATIWAEAFGLDQVGVHDNFFDLGGHSILAMQLFFRVCEAFQLDLPLKILLDAPTVAELAEKIAQYQIEQASTAAISATLEELSTLSPQEIEILLAQEMQSMQQRTVE